MKGKERMPAPFEYPPLELALDVQVESTWKQWCVWDSLKWMEQRLYFWISFWFFLDRFIQEHKITKERQTLVLSRITNSSVVFRGLNKRIMTYKLRCPNVTNTSGNHDCAYKGIPERTKMLNLGTWNTVFRSGLLAACSRPISWHHLWTYT
jgi:hypothetical protein